MLGSHFDPVLLGFCNILENTTLVLKASKIEFAYSIFSSFNFAGINFVVSIFSSPGRSPGRAIVLPPASALVSALALANVKVFYVMGKALSGELSSPCDRSC